MLAYDDPILGVFWSTMIFFLWVAWLFLLFRVFGDISRTQEMSGWAKALWSIFMIVVPFLGVFVYVIVYGQAMSKRDVAAAQQRDTDFQAYVRPTTGGAGAADELAKLAELQTNGALTEAEFAAQKAKLLAQ